MKVLKESSFILLKEWGGGGGLGATEEGFNTGLGAEIDRNSKWFEFGHY